MTNRIEDQIKIVKLSLILAGITIVHLTGTDTRVVNYLREYNPFSQVDHISNSQIKAYVESCGGIKRAVEAADKHGRDLIGNDGVNDKYAECINGHIIAYDSKKGYWVDLGIREE
jgi:hypothetical protein